MMGPLTETKQISLKDLGYAIENARDERVQRAAMVLLLVRLQQAVKEPPPATGFLHVVTRGRSFAERQQLFLTFIEGGFLGAGLMACVALFIWSVVRQVTTQSTVPWLVLLTSPSGILALVIAMGIGIGVIWLSNYLINRVTRSLEKQIDSHRLGQEGEERVVEVMRQSLDGNWHLFCNIRLPGRNKGDLDAVLVGPGGVWVLEIKSYNGEYRNIGDRWEYRKGNRWEPATSNPSRQAEDNAIRLANFLKSDNIKQWVTAVVVWANRESSLTVQNPTTTVWLLDRLPDELGNLWREPIPTIQREAIVRKLTQLCHQEDNSS
jgi:hypothetical protein